MVDRRLIGVAHAAINHKDVTLVERVVGAGTGRPVAVRLNIRNPQCVEPSSRMHLLFVYKGAQLIYVGQPPLTGTAGVNQPALAADQTAG